MAWCCLLANASRSFWSTSRALNAVAMIDDDDDGDDDDDDDDGI